MIDHAICRPSVPEGYEWALPVRDEDFDRINSLARRKPGWRDDVLGHDFGDLAMGPHVSVWRGGLEIHLFYLGEG